MNSTKELHQQEKSKQEQRRASIYQVKDTEPFGSNISLLPVCCVSGVGEAEDGAELHTQDEVQNEEGLVAQSARNIILLKRKKAVNHQALTYSSTSACILTVRPWGKSKPSGTREGAAGVALG